MLCLNTRFGKYSANTFGYVLSEPKQLRKKPDVFQY